MQPPIDMRKSQTQGMRTSAHLARIFVSAAVLRRYANDQHFDIDTQDARVETCSHCESYYSAAISLIASVRPTEVVIDWVAGHSDWFAKQHGAQIAYGRDDKANDDGHRHDRTKVIDQFRQAKDVGKVQHSDCDHGNIERSECIAIVEETSSVE